jgi:tRNA(Ile)-lysidine synthase
MKLAAAVVAVAVSGGKDSMALLHCTAVQAAEQGARVIALHVHHGLMPEADAWAALVQSTCQRWARRGLPVAFAMQRLQGKPARSQSVEAWAREGRYAALAHMAREAGATMVLLAHHQDDQAETFLLQALRGAGPAGLAAMPAVVARDGITWARPWLDWSGAAVAAYAKRHRLRHVQDASNADPRFARSRLRTQVMPALREAFPEAAATFSAAAVACAQAQTVLDEVSQADLLACSNNAALCTPALKALGTARAQAVVHAWLREQAGTAQRAGVMVVMKLLDGGRSAAVADVQAGQVRLYRARLTFIAAQARTPVASSSSRRLGSHPAPGGHLVVRAAQLEEPGLPKALLIQARWQARQGGEQFQRAPNTPPRSLKKAYQAAAVPVWHRDTPLLFSAQGELLFVPGLGMDARMSTSQGRGRLVLEWQAEA